MMSYSDTHWVQLAKTQGSHHAFNQLVRLHQSALRYSLLQLTNFNEPLAQDVAQETFLKAWKNIHRFEERASFFSWLYRIAYNELNSVYRKPCEYSNNAFSVDESSAAVGSIDPDFSVHRDIARALALLPVDRRSVLHLHLHRQLTHQEIADTLDMPLGTVKTHINRGRKQLQEALTNSASCRASGGL